MFNGTQNCGLFLLVLSPTPCQESLQEHIRDGSKPWKSAMSIKMQMFNV